MKVFISYQSEDNKYASNLADQLQVRGHEVTLYTHKLDDPVGAITQQLQQANLIFLLVGQSTYKSKWVSAEIFAAQVLKAPIITVLLDETSRTPDTLSLNSVVLAYPSLENTSFALLNIFPSRKMQTEHWKKIRFKINPYQHPDKLKLPEPLIDHKRILNRILLGLGYFLALASYFIGTLPPLLLYLALFGSEPNSTLQRVALIAMNLIWWVIFTFILFYKPTERLAYPLRILWFFKEYIPAWLSTRTLSVTKRMNEVMQRLSGAKGNHRFWELEGLRRTNNLPETSMLGHTKSLFNLLLEDERSVGPYGQFDEVGLTEIYELLSSISDFDGLEIVMLKHSPSEVEVFNRHCPAPFCIMGKSVRLKKVDGAWHILDKNW